MEAIPACIVAAYDGSMKAETEANAYSCQGF